MLKTNLQARFGIVEDVRVVEDPWGLGIKFFLSRAGRKKYQERQREKARKNPLLLAVQKIMAKSALASAAKSGGAVALNQEELIATAVADAARDLDANPAALEELFGDNRAGAALEIADLLDQDRGGWEGLLDEHGEPVPFSVDRAVELLSSEEWVDRNLPYGNRALGDALQVYLAEQSVGHELARRKVIEEAGKASAPSSVGDGASGSN